MNKVIKSLITLVTLAVLAGGLYYFWKNKISSEDLSDDFDDFDDFDDTDDSEEEQDTENSDEQEEERGYVTVKLHQEDEEKTKED